MVASTSAARSSSTAVATSATAAATEVLQSYPDRFHRHWRFYGFAYNTCWKYTPYGLVNVCKVWY